MRQWSVGSFATLATLSVAAAGCLGWDGTIDPRVGPFELPVVDGGPAYRVVEVRDVRAFREGIGGPWEHTLYEGDPADPALTQRVIARRRSRAQPRSDQRPRLGNIWLPEGRTVPELVAQSVTAGFRQAGLAVLDTTEAPRPDERAIRAEVVGFWGRARPTNQIVRVETWIRVHLTAPDTALERGVLVCAESMVAVNAPTGAAWRRSFEEGLLDLSRRIADVLRHGPPGYCVSP